MLVLSRRIGEAVVVGDGVCIKVLWASSGRVRLGIEAPADVEIRRSAGLGALSREQEAKPLVTPVGTDQL